MHDVTVWGATVQYEGLCGDLYADKESCPESECIGEEILPYKVWFLGEPPKEGKKRMFTVELEDDLTDIQISDVLDGLRNRIMCDGLVEHRRQIEDNNHRLVGTYGWSDV